MHGADMTITSLICCCYY